MTTKKAHEPVEADAWIAPAEQKGTEQEAAEQAAAPYRKTEADRLARIAVVERELEVLRRPLFAEYPKACAFAPGGVVNSAAEEAKYRPAVPVVEKPEPVEADEPHAKKHKKGAA